MFKEICWFLFGIIIALVSLIPYMQFTITAFCALPELRSMKPILDGLFDMKSCMLKFWFTLFFNLLLVADICVAILDFAPDYMIIGFYAWFGIFGASGIMKSGASIDANRVELVNSISRYFRNIPSTNEAALKILLNFESPIQSNGELSEHAKAAYKREHYTLRIAACIHFALCACIILYFFI